MEWRKRSRKGRNDDHVPLRGQSAPQGVYGVLPVSVLHLLFVLNRQRIALQCHGGIVPGVDGVAPGLKRDQHQQGTVGGAI